MVETIVGFLRLLEQAIPPPVDTHYPLTVVMQNGQPRLQLTIWVANTFKHQRFFVDEGDFDKPDVTIAAIQQWMREAAPAKRST